MSLNWRKPLKREKNYRKNAKNVSLAEPIKTRKILMQITLNWRKPLKREKTIAQK